MIVHMPLALDSLLFRFHLTFVQFCLCVARSKWICYRFKLTDRSMKMILFVTSCAMTRSCIRPLSLDLFLFLSTAVHWRMPVCRLRVFHQLTHTLYIIYWVFLVSCSGLVRVCLNSIALSLDFVFF
jgi:hypothetical protein